MAFNLPLRQFVLFERTKMNIPFEWISFIRFYQTTDFYFGFMQIVVKKLNL